MHTISSKLKYNVKRNIIESDLHEAISHINLSCGHKIVDTFHKFGLNRSKRLANNFGLDSNSVLINDKTINL